MTNDDEETRVTTHKAPQLSDIYLRFVAYLQSLASRDRGAMATLKRSLSFSPGTYPRAFPYIERFVGADHMANDPFRRALYLVAGLFALHPDHQNGRTFAKAFGDLRLRRESESIEKRFIAVLSADSDNLGTYLRQAVSLLSADGISFDYAALLRDLGRWLNDRSSPEVLDDLRQRWARDFYLATAKSINDQTAEDQGDE